MLYIANKVKKNYYTVLDTDNTKYSEVFSVNEIADLTKAGSRILGVSYKSKDEYEIESVLQQDIVNWYAGDYIGESDVSRNGLACYFDCKKHTSLGADYYRLLVYTLLPVYLVTDKSLNYYQYGFVGACSKGDFRYRIVDYAYEGNKVAYKGNTRGLFICSKQRYAMVSSREIYEDTFSIEEKNIIDMDSDKYNYVYLQRLCYRDELRSGVNIYFLVHNLDKGEAEEISVLDMYKILKEDKESVRGIELREDGATPVLICDGLDGVWQIDLGKITLNNGEDEYSKLILNNDTFVIPDGVKYIYSSSLDLHKELIKRIVIPSSLLKIGKSAGHLSLADSIEINYVGTNTRVIWDTILGISSGSLPEFKDIKFADTVPLGTQLDFYLRLLSFAENNIKSDEDFTKWYDLSENMLRRYIIPNIHLISFETISTIVMGIINTDLDKYRGINASLVLYGFSYIYSSQRYRVKYYLLKSLALFLDMIYDYWVNEDNYREIFKSNFDEINSRISLLEGQHRGKIERGITGKREHQII